MGKNGPREQILHEFSEHFFNFVRKLLSISDIKFLSGFNWYAKSRSTISSGNNHHPIEMINVENHGDWIHLSLFNLQKDRVFIIVFFCSVVLFFFVGSSILFVCFLPEFDTCFFFFLLPTHRFYNLNSFFGRFFLLWMCRITISIQSLNTFFSLEQLGTCMTSIS